MASSSKDVSAMTAGSDANSRDASTAEQLFTEGERIFAVHQNIMYEAKIVKVELRENQPSYYVHYLGWNKSWDEWISGKDRLLRYTEENILRQQENNEQMLGKKAKSVRTTLNKPKSSAANRGTKRKSDSTIQKHNSSSEKMIKIHIPSALRKQLIDERDLVTQQFKLVKLPRKPSVDDILGHYLDYKSNKEGLMLDSTVEILKGVRGYFDMALSRMLLYNEERQQYQETVLENASPSTIYGAEHLLRLFVKLPELLKHVLVEEETTNYLQQTLQDFLRFLQKNQAAYFLSSCDATEASKEKGNERDN